MRWRLRNEIAPTRSGEVHLKAVRIGRVNSGYFVRAGIYPLAAAFLFPHPAAQGQHTSPASPGIGATSGLHPNLIGKIGGPPRYRPDNGDFVIENGPESFNRSLYGGNTAFRVDGGDKPEFMMYLPGRGGNLRLGIRAGGQAKWLKDFEWIQTRYRPGELIYELRDRSLGAHALVHFEVLAYAATEGLVVRVRGEHLQTGSELIWAYGGVNGQRGSRDGDIGTERVPISQYFQFSPAFADDNTFSLGSEGFILKSRHAVIVGVVPSGASQHVADADHWNDINALLSVADGTPTRQIIVGTARLSGQTSLLLSLQRVNGGSVAEKDLSTYRDVTTHTPGEGQNTKAASLPPAYHRRDLAAQFALAEQHFSALRNKVRIETPDPYLNAAMGSLNVVSDALWNSDARAIMHGSIAWRTKLLGWRGPYVLDDLGWHERARQNFETWFPNQNRKPVGAVPLSDPKANLARNEPGLHSNGDLSNSHYDMNMVFIDALFRHLLWTGDTTFARSAWPVIQRHLAWEKRLFRREYGPEKLPLYEAYATIWASDDLYYSGGGCAYASAYNVYANRMAARIATMVGDDPAPYTDEADRIERAMHSLLWLPDWGTFAESKDLLGRQLVHPNYGLWNFYHTVDEEAVTPKEAWQMGADLETHLRPIPVVGQGVPDDASYHVLSETDWMPYSWSINNVVMDENMHTALALWQGGHTRDAYLITKGGLLASMYMGISPGNVGTMDYLDAYRRESQRDFGDAAGTMSRAIVEGLFGFHPDALAGTLSITPGFPAEWTHARINHPDVGLDFERKNHIETWEISQATNHFHILTMRIPVAFTGVRGVDVNGVPAHWQSDPDAVGRPLLKIVTPAHRITRIRITWTGDPISGARFAPAGSAATEGTFSRVAAGAFSWWAAAPKPRRVEAHNTQAFDWKSPRTGVTLESVRLDDWFNDRVAAIFVPGKYVSPRNPGVRLAIPSQGAGAWAGHLNTLPAIDDSGLRKAAAEHNGNLIMPNGVPFATPEKSDAKNVVFISQWDNYPHDITFR